VIFEKLNYSNVFSEPATQSQDFPAALALPYPSRVASI